MPLSARPRSSRALPGAVRPLRAPTRARRPALERLENRTVLSVSVASNYTGLDFKNSGGYTPPDTNGAAGPTSYVETVNQAVALYSSKTSNTPAATSFLANFWYTTGKLARADSGSGLSDPVVTYDDQIGRFIVGDQDVNFSTHVSTFDIAVSKTSSPGSLAATDWSFYQIKTTEAGFDADYPGNFGYNHDAVVFTLNMFGVYGGGHVQVISVTGADLANNVAPTVYKNDLNDFAVRPAVMHDAVANDPMWLVTEHVDNKSIDVIKMGKVLSNAASFTTTNLPVGAYSPTLSPLNPDGTTITTNLDARIEKAAESKNLLVACQDVAVNGVDVAQWYAVDVSGGTPALQQQGQVGGGPKTYVTYPSIDVNAAGQIGMTYMKSGTDSPTDYLSMYVTGRNPGDPAGTMEASVLVPAGAGQANYHDFTGSGRAGDLSGINVDPKDGSFWAANEFANTEATANWGTAIANFTIANPLPAADVAVTVTGPSPSPVDVSSGATTATYTITVTNNPNNNPNYLNPAQGLVLSDILPAGSTYVSMTPSTLNTDTFTLAQSGGTITETATAGIASGASDTFTLVVNAPASLANGAAFNDTASVQANNPDPDTTNNTATATGTVVNTNPNADLSVSVSGPTSGTEGGTVTYTITVTNAGPATATGVSLADTLASILNYKSATTSQGTVTQSGGVVTFNIGAIAAGGKVTATVTAQAIEDGGTSNNASVSSSTPDPNLTNNTAGASTTFAEPSIQVSSSITTRSLTLTNYQVATFTHAGGIEPIGAFSATINWGDGKTSPGTITLSGTTYTVIGSHTYSNTNRHTIKTTVVETGNSPVQEGGGKLDVNPGTLPWNQRDVVQLPQGWRDDSPTWTDPLLNLLDGALAQFQAGRKRSDSATDGLTDDWFADLNT